MRTKSSLLGRPQKSLQSVRLIAQNTLLAPLHANYAMLMNRSLETLKSKLPEKIYLFDFIDKKAFFPESFVKY